MVCVLLPRELQPMSTFDWRGMEGGMDGWMGRPHVLYCTLCTYAQLTNCLGAWGKLLPQSSSIRNLQKRRPSGRDSSPHR